MKIRIVVQPGEDPDEMWRRHVCAYVAAGMCPRCQNELDAYGRCHLNHGQWWSDGLSWTWNRS